MIAGCTRNDYDRETTVKRREEIALRHRLSTPRTDMSDLTPEMHRSDAPRVKEAKRLSYSPPSPLLLSPQPFRRRIAAQGKGGAASGEKGGSVNATTSWLSNPGVDRESAGAPKRAEEKEEKTTVLLRVKLTRLPGRHLKNYENKLCFQPFRAGRS